MTLPAAYVRTPERLMVMQMRMAALDSLSRRLLLALQAMVGSGAVVASVVR